MGITTLYAKGAYGLKVWEIWNEDNIIVIRANGALYREAVHEGKAGRSLSDQVELRMEARIRSKLASGFKRSKEELGATNTNQLGFVMPMLACHAKDIRGLRPRDCYIQPKLDGHRCLVNNSYAYSRGGKLIETIPEIQAALNLPEGVTIDGELYCHGFPLQTIASWAKRRQANTLKLSLNVYDVVMEGAMFPDRWEWIVNMIRQSDFVKLVPTEPFDPINTVDDYYAAARADGYEGAILRPRTGLYEPGKRSRTLLKVKKRFDDEFECVDIQPDRVGNGVLHLKTTEGKIFKTVAPGDNYRKKWTLENKARYIGRMVTCEYAELSIEKIPQHCVAIRWRADI